MPSLYQIVSITHPTIRGLTSQFLVMAMDAATALSLVQSSTVVLAHLQSFGEVFNPADLVLTSREYDYARDGDAELYMTI